MPKSVQFPVKLPRDFETLIKFEGKKYINNPTVGQTSNSGPTSMVTTLKNGSTFSNTSNSFQIPAGRCLWIESITFGATVEGKFTVTFQEAGSENPWGLGDTEVYRAGGKTGVITLRKWFTELTTVQFAFQPFKANAHNVFFASVNGIDFTGNAGLNFGANKSLLLCGPSTSWDLIGDWKDDLRDTYKSVPSGSTPGSVNAVDYMLPDYRGNGADNSEANFGGDSLVGNRLVYDFMENGKDWRFVNKSFGGSQFIKNWYGALQVGYINGVNTDLLMVEAGINDSDNGEWTQERRELFKNRLAEFTTWRNRWNPDAPVVYISPVTNDDGFGINTTNSPGFPANGYTTDPRTGVDFNTRNTWDSGSNGEYVSGSTTYYMTRIEIARQLVKEVATLSSYGGGTDNNVYYIDGLQSDWEYNTIWRQETQDGSGSVDYIQQQGLRFAKYYRLEDVEAGQSGSISHQAKDDGWLPSDKAIVGEIQYFTSASDSPSPVDMSPYTGVDVDTEDILFKYTSGFNEQISGKRLHRSPQGQENHFYNIKTQLINLGLYENL